MLILKSRLFESIPGIIFGFGTKVGLSRDAPYFFNLSYSVGDEEAIVKANRKAFFDALGISPDNSAYQRQVHGDSIRVVEKPGMQGESDALITRHPEISLTVTSADCAAIFIYDMRIKAIAAVHSGWRGTGKDILRKTLEVLRMEFNSSPTDLLVYIAPSVSQRNYQVGHEVASLFRKEFVKVSEGKYYLDVSGINYSRLVEFGIPETQIQRSFLCSFAQTELLHSYRRDGERSGRALGTIMMRR